MRLSLVIPSWKDPLSERTVADALEHSELGDQLEVIVIWDGYFPSFPIHADPRVRYLHLGTNRGMREAINAGISVSRGEFVARSDEHCSFGQGWDRVLCDACQPDWIVTARRYALDPMSWTVMDSVPPVDYERLATQGIGQSKKFTGMPTERPERAEVLVDETQAMQGSFWLMPRAWWDAVVGPLDSERYGSHYQDSHEMHFKTLRAGGRLMVCKSTWFAHKHVSFPRTHNVTHASHAEYLQRFYDDWKGDYRQARRRWQEAG